MSSITFPCKAPLAEGVKQNQKHEDGKEEAPKEGDEKKGSSKKRRERRRNKKAEGATTPTGIESPSPQSPTSTPAPIVTHLRAPTPLITSSTTSTYADPSAPRKDDQPISGSALVPPLPFAFGSIKTTFGQSQQASLPIVPSAINPSPFAFGPVSTTFTQAPPPPPPQKFFTEAEVNLRISGAKAQTRAEAYDEIMALESELEWLKKLKKELNAANRESTASKEQQLEATKEELTKANKELKLTQENLDGTETRLAATEARIDWQMTELERTKAALNLTQEALKGAETQLVATKACVDKKTAELECAKVELDLKKTALKVLEAELAVTREALVVSNKKLSNGLMQAKQLVLPIFLLLLAVSLMLLWLAWTTTTSIQLPLAVVSRIDSAHMYPEEMSEAWMTMDEFGWFGE